MEKGDFKKWIERYKYDGVMTFENPNSFLFNHYEQPEFLNLIRHCLCHIIFKPEEGKPTNVSVLVNNIRYCVFENSFLLHINLIRNGFNKEYVVTVKENENNKISFLVENASRILLAHFESANVFKQMKEDRECDRI